MAKNEVMKLALDAINGNVSGNFSAKDTNAGIREGLIELNGGSDKLNIKNFYRGSELYAFVEEILPIISNDGLKGDEFWMNYVDSRNLSDGDAMEFYAPDNSLFLVGNMAEGSQSIRRQRIGVGTTVTVPVQLHGIRIYEEMRRILAGRVDFTDMVARVGESMTQAKYKAVKTLFDGITAATPGLNSNYVISGTYSENDLLGLVEHVEAATGKQASILGTKMALRKVTIGSDANGEAAKTDRYGMGFYGTFAGTPMIQIPQSHITGTDTFLLSDNKLYVVAADDKFIKFVTEGDGLLIERNFEDNADLTQSYLYAERYGAGLMINQKMGVYTI